MPSPGLRSSGILSRPVLVALAVILCALPPAGAALAQARDPILPGLFGGKPDAGRGTARPAKPTARPTPAAQTQSEKPAGGHTHTPFGTVYRPLDSNSFVPFDEPETAPLQPKSPPREPARAAPEPEPSIVPVQTAPTPAPQQPEPEPAPPPVEAPASAPVPANVPLPPRAPANRGPASLPTPENPAAPAAPQTPVAVPPPANLPPVSNLSDRQIVERANRFFNTLDTMQASFTQLGGNQRTSGTLYLERPGRVRFAYNPPSTLEIVSDGKNVAIRDSKLKTSDVYAINQTPLKFLLRDPINLGSDLKVLEVVRDPTSIQLTLEDASTIGGKAQIILFFDQQIQNLTRWTIVDAQGFTTTVILSQVKRTRRDGAP